MTTPKRSLRRPTLMLITDRAHLRGRSLESVATAAVEGGVDAVQLRAKELPGRDLYELAATLRSALGGRAALIVNDRADVAIAAGATGVHLPERSLPVDDVRAIGCESMLIGRSVHSVRAARCAARHGVDYLQAGAVYETASKPGAQPAGVGLLRDVAAAVDTPIIAVGGITPERVPEVIAAGATGVAVIGAIMDADDPQRAATELRAALDAAMS